MADTIKQAQAEIDGARPLRPRLSLANMLPLIALAVFGTLFIRHIATLDGAAVWAAFQSLSVWQIAAALVFTALSFRALGLYDILVHRVLNTGQTTQAARAAGVKAIALSQTIGFGTITAALVRWRCLPSLSAGGALRLSVIVSLSFLAALAIVAAFVVPWSGLLAEASGWNVTIMLGGGVAVAALLILARLAHRLGWLATPVRMATFAALIGATLADTLFAAAALWVLWPEAISLPMIFAAYLVALGAGLLSNAPSGLGAFDLTLLALLPISDDASAMAALLAFRLIYYALPAALALVSLIKPPLEVSDAPLPHPEAALTLQGAQVHPHPKGALLTLSAWRNGAVLGDLPRGLEVADLSAPLDPRALYKCSARQAGRARAQGWAVLRCAAEAFVDPQVWSPDGASRRQLRRALRQFDGSGLHIAQTRDFSALTSLAAQWACDQGGEKGHSMGRFAPDYIARQCVFAAFDGTQPVAFVSFHTGPIWTLDLIRYTADVPHGTIHALITTAIEVARAQGVTRLSLAAVTDTNPTFPFADRLRCSAAGLRRFKASFGPDWQPLYTCARTPADLWMTGLTLAWAIHRPAPLPTAPNHVHSGDEDFSFAPARAA